MKTSYRINELKKAVNKNAEVVWDLCCDHGKIGISLFKENRKIIFVDQVEHIISNLRKKLEISKFNTKFQVIDAKEINIFNSKDESIIIAGVGGHTCIDIMSNILDRFGHLKSEFILSPQKNLIQVYEFLRLNQFNVISEKIIVDSKVKYHIIKVKQKVLS